MYDWPLICLGGMLGSSHCVGMCGGFAVSIGLGGRGTADNLRRQMLYSVGRIATYSFCGAVVGFAGLRLMQGETTWNSVRGILAVIAGVLLCTQGLSTLGIARWRFRGHRSASRGCVASFSISRFLRNRGWLTPFLAGVLTGFLPCGLVYSFLALAASSGSIVLGAATMTVFGLGTVPAMVLTGAGAPLCAPSFRLQLLRAAALCVLLTGILSVGRGLESLGKTPAQVAESSCPFCGPRNSAMDGWSSAASAPEIHPGFEAPRQERVEKRGLAPNRIRIRSEIASP